LVTPVLTNNPFYVFYCRLRISQTM